MTVSPMTTEPLASATTSHFRLRYHHWLVLGLALFSMVMSAFVSRSVFERLPHLEDEVAYLFQAKTYAGGHLVIDSPDPRRAFWQPFVVDYGLTGKRFSKYSPGWPLLLALGVAGGQPWLVNALLSALTVALVYRLGREIFDADTGVIAAALTAFSPMALLLNATLMGHTAALCAATLFFYAYWRIEQRKNALKWGAVAGVALGLVIINRPLTAIGITTPLVLWSGIRLLRGFISPHTALAKREEEKTKSPLHRMERGFRGEVIKKTLFPLLVLTIIALLIAAAIPIYNYAATGDPTYNLYTLVWRYDTVGFGECCGRNGHTLEKGIRHVRFDLSLMAADLYGWQLGQITPQLQEHLRTQGSYWPLIGLSWVLLPFGLLVGARRRWTWLLAGVALCLIGVHVAYWIGSQRYSTRYYFETLTALSLISALPLSWLIRKFNWRWPVYALLAAVLLYSLYFYSTPRIMALYGFNQINRATLEGVEARREGDRPALVIVSGGDVRWRAMGALMAVTSPFLDSDIVLAWDNLQPGVRDQILARFPERQIIEMEAQGNQAWFVDG